MSNDPRIENPIREIFNKLNIKDPVIDVGKIAESYQVEIIYQDFDDNASGLLLIKDGKAVIAVNADNPPNRQRFTIAHELGHYFLHAEKNTDDLFIDQSLYHRNAESSKGTNNIEIDANKFAASLLMPESMIKEAIANNELDLSDDYDLSLLAQKFQVSDKAMSYRLGNLDLCFGTA